MPLQLDDVTIQHLDARNTKKAAEAIEALKKDIELQNSNNSTDIPVEDDSESLENVAVHILSDKK